MEYASEAEALADAVLRAAGSGLRHYGLYTRNRILDAAQKGIDATVGKKPEPRPLFPLKHEFVESLDAYAQEVTMLRIAVRGLLDVPMIPERVREIIRERLDALDERSSEGCP